MSGCGDPGGVAGKHDPGEPYNTGAQDDGCELAKLEEDIVDVASPIYCEIHAWWILRQFWWTLRFDAHRHHIQRQLDDGTPLRTTNERRGQRRIVSDGLCALLLLHIKSNLDSCRLGSPENCR